MPTVTASFGGGSSGGRRREPFAFGMASSSSPALPAAPAPAPEKFVNQHGKKAARRNAYPRVAASAGMLSNAQKAEIAILARQAWEKLPEPRPCDGDVDAWRHGEQVRAVGHDSLRRCTQADYLPLVRHFAVLAGEAGRELKAVLREESQDKRVALYKLEEELKAQGLPPAYVVPICRSKYKCELANATHRQIWNLVFELRKRRAKKKGASR